jgi:hypothetical protein
VIVSVEALMRTYGSLSSSCEDLRLSPPLLRRKNGLASASADAC